MRADDAVPPGLVPRRYRSPGRARAARARRAERLRPVLDAFLASRDPAAHLARDPVRFPRRYPDPVDQELVGLVASTLAFGNVTAIGASVARVLEVLGPHPARAVVDLGPARLDRALAGFVHRWIRGGDVAALLAGAGAVLERRGRLGAAFEAAFAAHDGALRPAVAAFAAELRGRAPGRDLAWLLPDGTGPGAAKRVHMYLRWMVRGPGPVDLGLWDVPPSALLVPLDTHTGRIARYVGLTGRRDATWRTAEEVTWNLRALDPLDPVKYDFALCHLGVSRGCLHRRVPDTCGRCDLKAVCRL